MKAILEFNLPEDAEEFNVASKSMDWALLAWDIDQMIRSLLKYHPDEYKTGEQALECFIDPRTPRWAKDEATDNDIILLLNKVKLGPPVK